MTRGCAGVKMTKAAPALRGGVACKGATTHARTSMDSNEKRRKEEKEMRKNMSREKGQRSTKRRKRNHNQRSSRTKQVPGVTSGLETNSPSPTRETEIQPTIEEQIEVLNMTQSGGLQGTAGAKASASETIAELFEEGEDFESELGQGVENALMRIKVK
jgi:hypothetical protein